MEAKKLNYWHSGEGLDHPSHIIPLPPGYRGLATIKSEQVKNKLFEWIWLAYIKATLLHYQKISLIKAYSASVIESSENQLMNQCSSLWIQEGHSGLMDMGGMPLYTVMYHVLE